MSSLRVLIVEDSENDASLILAALRRGGWTVSHERVDTAAAMIAALDAHCWDVIIADYTLPRFSGAAALQIARERAADLPIIVVSGTVGEETAVAAMKQGADDYLFKENLSRLAPAMERELRMAVARRKAALTEKELQQAHSDLIASEGLARSNLALQNEVAERMVVQTTLQELNETLEQRVADRTAAAEARTREWMESESRFRQLAERIDCIFWMYQPEDGKFSYINSAYEAITGRTIQSRLDDPASYLEAVHPEDRQRVKAAMDQWIGGGNTCEEYRIVRTDGALRWICERGFPIADLNGQIYRVAGLSEDITAHKNSDAEVQKAKEAAEEANRAKSEFLANMSHEIRTPMTAIMGFAEMMLGSNQEPGDRTECVQIIRRNAQHLLELVNGILDLSKIEAGKMSAERIAFDLPQFLADIISTMRPRAQEKGLAFEISFAGPIPRQVQSDVHKFRQILVNLLGNAIKFTDRGRIEMCVSFEPSEACNFLRIGVVDSGIGMTEAELGRLFQPFTQADESTTRRFGGTGLGLTISRRLARLLNGDIVAESQQGKGSTFTVSIDSGVSAGSDFIENLTESTLPSAVGTLPHKEVLLRGRILLAEDGRDNQRLLSTHLRTAGAEVTIAENGRIAVDLAAALPFDLILMDMQMPEMDGYTATEELRRRGFTVPIVALTANAMAEDRARCLASGCSDYLSKPIERETFLKTVSQHLGQPTPSANPEPETAKAAPGAARGKIVSTLAHLPTMQQIITEFVMELPGEVKKIEQFLESRDLDAIRRVVHQLRGAGGRYGFDSISETAARAEESIKAADNLQTISEQIKSLIDVIQHVQGFDESEATTPTTGEMR